jgi:glycosyltransferase involved in cell wall biosynthesis
MEASVIVCAHNPRMDFLKRVLDALRSQSLPLEQWELLVIDNASDQHLAEVLDLSWHPHAQVIREEALGLTMARLRGSSEAKSDLLVFVDDDNVLDDEYLAESLKIKREWPIIGVWGGSVRPLFETEPPPWSKPYLGYLALREVKEICWSNFMGDASRMPVGAGMCVRRGVAEEYTRKLSSDPTRRALDRRGKSLSSCGDFDLALTACDIGLGTGLFPRLSLIHLIPANRLQADYLFKLLEGVCYSSAMLKAIRGYPLEPYSWFRSMRGYISALKRGMWETRFYRASLRGNRSATREIATWK